MTRCLDFWMSPWSERGRGVLGEALDSWWKMGVGFFSAIDHFIDREKQCSSLCLFSTLQGISTQMNVTVAVFTTGPHRKGTEASSNPTWKHINGEGPSDHTRSTTQSDKLLGKKRHALSCAIVIFPIWVWVKTYYYQFNGMNIHLPAILVFTRGTGFWPISIYHRIQQVSSVHHRDFVSGCWSEVKLVPDVFQEVNLCEKPWFPLILASLNRINS